MNKALTHALVAGLLTALTGAPAGYAENAEVLWLGHATTRITSVNGKVIVIDPFLKKNPKTPVAYKDLKRLGQVDLILVTHGHFDHVHDLVDLAELSTATVVANFEFALQMVQLGLLDGNRVIAMNKGGTVSPLGRGIKIHMVPADHSSGVDLQWLEPVSPESKNVKAGIRWVAGGAPVGYVVELENGFKIYHSGDTNVFGDMALIHRFHAPDLALVCIGGHFTMDPKAAAYAVRELLKPRQVLPIHYGTYPLINRSPAEFEAALGDSGIEVLKRDPGDPITITIE